MSQCNRTFPTIETGQWNGQKARDAPTITATPQEGNDFINAVVADPEAPSVVPDYFADPNTLPSAPFDPFGDPLGDPDGDGSPNRADPDPEGDGDPDGDGDPNEHPHPYPWPAPDDPEGDGDPDHDGDPNEIAPYPTPPQPEKPWLLDGFRAPQGSAQREALWGPVIGTWTTPAGGECFLFESGAQLCDSAGGTTFVWIDADWTAWMQHSDNSKDQLVWPGGPPPIPPSGSGGDSDDDEDEADIGNMLDFLFGNAQPDPPENHNYNRSQDLNATLTSIGINDTPANREFMSNELNRVYKDPDAYLTTQRNGRIWRESLLMGPVGGAKMQTLWQGNKPITVYLKR